MCTCHLAYHNTLYLRSPFNKIIIVNIRANGRRAGAVLSIRARATQYLSSHRCPLACPTKKEIGSADCDPFVFGQRPARGAGWKMGGADWPLGPRPPRRLSSQFKGGCRRVWVVWVQIFVYLTFWPIKWLECTFQALLVSGFSCHDVSRINWNMF